ncbi:hypothetical protein Leryth_021358 [Lithospermum erythrorhizon]|nr:hypothetical protein Leryth_021358 [Lithospermum erythrorhizon]
MVSSIFTNGRRVFLLLIIFHLVEGQVPPEYTCPKEFECGKLGNMSFPITDYHECLNDGHLCIGKKNSALFLDQLEQFLSSLFAVMYSSSGAERRKLKMVNTFIQGKT